MHIYAMMTYEEFGSCGAGCTKEYLVGQGGMWGTIMTLNMMAVEGMMVEREGDMMVMTMMMVVLVERDAW